MDDGINDERRCFLGGLSMSVVAARLHRFEMGHMCGREPGARDGRP
jgi:hypothetical protein